LQKSTEIIKKRGVFYQKMIKMAKKMAKMRKSEI